MLELCITINAARRQINLSHNLKLLKSYPLEKKIWQRNFVCVISSLHYFPLVKHRQGRWREREKSRSMLQCTGFCKSGNIHQSKRHIYRFVAEKIPVCTTNSADYMRSNQNFKMTQNC